MVLPSTGVKSPFKICKPSTGAQHSQSKLVLQETGFDNFEDQDTYEDTHQAYDGQNGESYEEEMSTGNSVGGRSSYLMMHPGLASQLSSQGYGNDSPKDPGFQAFSDSTSVSYQQQVYNLQSGKSAQAAFNSSNANYRTPSPPLHYQRAQPQSAFHQQQQYLQQVLLLQKQHQYSAYSPAASADYYDNKSSQTFFQPRHHGF